MASAAVGISNQRQTTFAKGWIISRKDDLIWFIGSVAASYVFLAANLWLMKIGLSVMIVTWVWALGFDGPTRNSLDSVASRDFAAEFLFACAMCATHLSRFAEEVETRDRQEAKRLLDTLA